MAQQVRKDEELGLVRWCAKCAEWWPDDTTFWVYHTYRAGDVVRAGGRFYTRRTDGVSGECRACRGDMNPKYHVANRRKAGVTHHQCMTPPFTRPCPVRVPVGRTRCYGCEGQTAGLLTVERLRELGHAVA